MTGTAPIDNRGGDRKLMKFQNKKNAVIDFIKKFNVMEVHYCRSKVAYRQYLNSNLNINKLFNMYDKDITAPN